MKRPLEYIAGGFVLGEVLALLPVVWTVGILAALAVGVCYLWNRNGRGLVWWLLPVFCVLGLCWIKRDWRNWEEYRQRAEEVKGKGLKIEGTVEGIQERKSGDGLVLELTEVMLRDGEKAAEYGNVLAYVDSDVVVLANPADRGVIAGRTDMAWDENLRGYELTAKDLAIGMRVSLEGELAPFDRAGNPGEFDFGKYYHALGIEARFYGESVEILSADYAPYLEGIYRLKRRAAKVLETICTEKDEGIFRAMVLGEKTELSDYIKDLYQSSGIAHLLAISGLHISMIGMGVFGLSRKMGMGTIGAGLTAGAVTVSYGIMAGGAGISASVVRAVVMVLMQMAAVSLGRTYDLRTALAVCAMVLLVQSPTLLFQAGFQLSFGAVLALGVVEPIVEQWVGADGGPGKMLLSGVVVQLVTCPVILYHYFEYPPYGTILNLVVIPLMSYVLLSGILGVVLGSIWPVFGMAAVGTGHYVLEFYQAICERVQKLPWSIVVTGRPKRWQIGCYVLLWVGFLAVAAVRGRRDEEYGGYGESGGKRKAPGNGSESAGREERSKDSRRTVRFVLFVICTLGILMFRVPPKGLEVTFLDVGQGDGICVRTKDVVILVDGGSSDRKNLGEQVLEPFLKSQGIRQVDYAVVSHGDQDHISGLRELVENGEIKVSNVVLPWSGRSGTDGIYGELEGLAESHGAKVEWMKRGDRICRGGLEIDCLYPGTEDHADTAGDRNEHSLLLLVTYGQAGILLTGDMSSQGEEKWLDKGERPKVQVLKVAHHGSAYSTGESFLERIAPSLAVISCGEGNRYGHPAPETLRRMEEAGVSWYLTQEWGAVTVRTDGNRLTVRGYLSSP